MIPYAEVLALAIGLKLAAGIGPAKFIDFAVIGFHRSQSKGLSKGLRCQIYRDAQKSTQCVFHSLHISVAYESAL